MSKPLSEDAPTREKKSRVAVPQSAIPSHSLRKALVIAQGLWDNFAGTSLPHDLAIALNYSLASSGWRSITGAAAAYGLTTGAYNAKEIGLTDLGRRIVAPTEEGDDERAKMEAALKPTLLNQFFAKYDSAKLPKDEVAKNVLVSLGVPKDRAETTLELLKDNGKFAGLIRETKTGPFVFLAHAPQPSAGPAISSTEVDEEDDLVAVSDWQSPGSASPIPTLAAKRPQRVFITHGKNTKILEQIKEIVRYGKFEPVISVEHETVSKPVPEKVLDDMRACDAAIIHVAQEGVLADIDGKMVPQINGNVLIEIGAAMALYKRQFILLVEEGVKLPSNLQGLYECRYSGDNLDGFATMKLLKAFNDFTAA